MEEQIACKWQIYYLNEPRARQRVEGLECFKLSEYLSLMILPDFFHPLRVSNYLLCIIEQEDRWEKEGMGKRASDESLWYAENCLFVFDFIEMNLRSWIFCSKFLPIFLFSILSERGLKMKLVYFPLGKLIVFFGIYKEDEVYPRLTVFLPGSSCNFE